MPPIIHRPSIPVPLPLSRGGLGAITAAGGRSTLGLGTAALEDYEEGTFTATGTGFSGTAPAVTAAYVRLGKIVTVALPQIGGTSNNSGFTITGIPAGLAPLFRAHINAIGVNNGTPAVLIIAIDSLTWDIYPFPSFSFVASGDKALWNTAVVFQLA